MSPEIEAPEPRVDPNPDEGDAAGGVDAVSPRHAEQPVTPEPPISAQLDEEAVPEEIQERDDSDQEGRDSAPRDNGSTSEPAG